MIPARSSARQRGQWSLVGSLVAIAILIGLAAWLIPKYAAPHSAPGEAATPTERAYGAACSEYQSQMNMAVQTYKQSHDDRPPRSLEDLKKEGITDDMIHAQGCSFVMDPATGTVTDVGKGQAMPGAPAPVTLGSPGSSAPQSAPPSNGGQIGPGGVKLPPMSGPDPSAGGGL